jgi:Uma2 family endonuclease
MSQPALHPVDVASFLAFAQRQERWRFELWDGEIVAMAPERVEHVRAKAAIWRALQAAIEKAELPCQGFVDGPGVAIDANTAYEPDALANCGEKIPTGAMLAPSPVVMPEVVSPTSGNRDKTLEVEGYFRVPTVRHYLVVDLSKRIVLQYRRDGGARIALTLLHDGAAELDPPGLGLASSEIFG